MLPSALFVRLWRSPIMSKIRTKECIQHTLPSMPIRRSICPWSFHSISLGHEHRLVRHSRKACLYTSPFPSTLDAPLFQPSPCLSYAPSSACLASVVPASNFQTRWNGLLPKLSYTPTLDLAPEAYLYAVTGLTVPRYILLSSYSTAQLHSYIQSKILPHLLTYINVV